MTEDEWDYNQEWSDDEEKYEPIKLSVFGIKIRKERTKKAVLLELDGQAFWVPKKAIKIGKKEVSDKWYVDIIRSSYETAVEIDYRYVKPGLRGFEEI